QMRGLWFVPDALPLDQCEDETFARLVCNRCRGWSRQGGSNVLRFLSRVAQTGAQTERPSTRGGGLLPAEFPQGRPALKVLTSRSAATVASVPPGSTPLTSLLAGLDQQESMSAAEYVSEGNVWRQS